MRNNETFIKIYNIIERCYKFLEGFSEFKIRILFHERMRLTKNKY
jgi:hypothetical protein